MSAKYRIALMGAILVSLTILVPARAIDFSERPEAFVGSKASQEYQLTLADTHNVAKVRYARHIREARDLRKLIRIYPTKWYFLDEDLGKRYPYRELMYFARPWVKEMLDCMSREFFSEFDKRLKVTSLIRTPYRQRQIMGANANARLSLPSAHFTGSAVDISKKNLRESEVAWLREWLYQRVTGDQLVVVEEVWVLNFHIFVNPTFECHTLDLADSLPITSNSYSCSLY